MTKTKKQAVSHCKYCGTPLHDYREFCDQYCKSDYYAEDYKADYDRDMQQAMERW